jgi:hypothetical protein
VTRLALFGLLVVVAQSASGAENLSAALGPEWKQLPDWRGVWFLEEPLVFPGPANAVIAPATTGSGAAPASSPTKFAHGVTPGSHFTGAPYKPEYQKQYDALVAKARESGAVEDPIENCYSPYGMPRLMGAAAGAMEIHVTPKQTWMIWDHMNETRRIHTDGRPVPGEDMKWPRVMGISRGKWEGQTLVIETLWMKEGIFDRTGAPHSDQLSMTERITRTDASTLTVEMTLEDPVMFTKPWVVTRHYKKSPKKLENVPGTYCAYDPAAEPPK